MSVNELEQEWREEAKTMGGEVGVGFHSAARGIARVARTAWNPIASRDDAKSAPQEMLMVRKMDGSILQEWGPALLSDWDIYTHWARVSDVVLLPASTTGASE